MGFTVVESLLPPARIWYVFREYEKQGVVQTSEIEVEFSGDSIIRFSKKLTEEESVAVRAAFKIKKDEFNKEIEQRISDAESN